MCLLSITLQSTNQSECKYPLDLGTVIKVYDQFGSGTTFRREAVGYNWNFKNAHRTKSTNDNYSKWRVVATFIERIDLRGFNVWNIQDI